VGCFGLLPSCEGATLGNHADYLRLWREAYLHGLSVQPDSPNGAYNAGAVCCIIVMRQLSYRRRQSRPCVSAIAAASYKLRVVEHLRCNNACLNELLRAFLADIEYAGDMTWTCPCFIYCVANRRRFLRFLCTRGCLLEFALVNFLSSL
jgi:hypothetical protein